MPTDVAGVAVESMAGVTTGLEDRGRRISQGQDISVVIAQRGHAELTVRCVTELRRWESPELEIVVVDDGTQADWGEARDVLEKANVVVVDQAPLGVTAAWNRGWQACHGETVVFLNNDVELAGPIVEQLREPLRERPRLVTGVEWRWEGTLPCEPVDARSREIEGEVVDEDPSHVGGAIRGWRCLAGYCFAVRRDWLQERGGFDERMRVYWSDTDLQWEARRTSGARALVKCAVNGAVKHLGHRTAHDPRQLPDRRAQWQRDRGAFLEKWARSEVKRKKSKVKSENAQEHLLPREG